MEAGSRQSRWRQRFRGDAADYEDRMAEVAVPGVVKEANGILMSAKLVPWEQIASHRDIGPHNILYDGTELTGSVDWDGAWTCDRARVFGAAVGDLYYLDLPRDHRRLLVDYFLAEYAARLWLDLGECRRHALLHALTRVLDRLCYQKGPMKHAMQRNSESLEALGRWVF